jgi:hypothetical protein
MKTLLVILLSIISINLKSQETQELILREYFNDLQEKVVSLGQDRIVDIEINNKTIKKKIFWVIGTGTIFYIKLDTIVLPCLVTAKHVFYDPQNNWYPDSLNIRFSWYDDKPVDEYFGIKIPLRKDNINFWFAHPDSNVDLVCIPLTEYKGLTLKRNINVLPYSMFAKKDDYYAGRKVWVFGYPGAVGTEFWNKAILREGIISWINSKEPDKSHFLIDCDVFPGNSGGPVFLIPRFQYEGKLAFLGIVSQRRFEYKPITDSKDKIQLQILGAKMQSKESISIGVIEPASRVEELLKEYENLYNEFLKNKIETKSNPELDKELQRILNK